MYEIKIYGEIISTYAKQSGMRGVSLPCVQAQLEKAEGQDLKVRINSVGGDVAEGFEIYNELRRYAIKHKAKIHTFGEGMVASVATVIFLVGNTREITKTLDPFAHNAQYMVEGDSRDFKAAVADLERWNDRIAKHYSDHTRLSYKDARELMDAEAFITPEQAKSMGFATKIESISPPAILAKYNSNQNKMSNKKTLMQRITALIGGFQNKIVFAADEKEIDFYELGEDDEVTVGAKATIDGEDADGEIVGADGKTYVFAAGELIEIREAEEVDPDAETVEVLTAKLEEMTQKYNALSAKLKEQSKVIAKAKAMRSASPDFGTTERTQNRQNQDDKSEIIRNAANLKLK